MIIVDMDSLIIPARLTPDVEGTPGYIAPEVMATLHLANHDPKKKQASIRSDQHALAILLYEYLFNRHPLRGPKIHNSQSAEEDERLSLGKKALFIEHPEDDSNHPKTPIKTPVTLLGSTLTPLFYKAFINGLHDPYQRVTAYQWEQALIKTWDQLYPCPNLQCSHQWFIVNTEHNQIICPFCNIAINTPFPVLTLLSQKIPKGEWKPYRTVVIYSGLSLFKWHIFNHIFPNPFVDRTPQAYCVFYQDKWLLINQALPSLFSPQGHQVKINQAIELKAGIKIHFSDKKQGFIGNIAMLHNND